MVHRPKSSRRGWLLASATGVLLLACVLGWRQWYDSYHFATVKPGVLYRDGLRSWREFNIGINAARPKTIISLVSDAEMSEAPFRDEPAYCAERGIRFERIPIEKTNWPSDADAKRFVEIVSDPANQPVLVHCAQGVRRTGMMVTIFNESCLKLDDRKAKESILPFGKTGKTLAELQQFVLAYDGPSKDVREQFKGDAAVE